MLNELTGVHIFLAKLIFLPPLIYRVCLLGLWGEAKALWALACRHQGMRRALRAALVAAIACPPLLDWEGRSLRLSRHAAERRDQRKVSCESLQQALKTCEPFPYRHQRRLKTGCYDEKGKVFVAVAGGTILTVIAEPGKEYVERLKRSAP